ncbi:LppA family lipoprotein [Mycoplasma capricolum subsp. capricolum]|uniref:LppA family lipoprotein n=1 Tax=Mycoplasma capricolum TaxID=2095 RepID=UPI003DA6B92A
MRKFSKLFLTFLPISSLSIFSVVSCTTNNKNNKPNEIPQLPNSKKPDNKPGENKSELADKTNNEKSDPNKPNSEKQSEDEPNPSESEHKLDNNSHNSKPSKPNDNSDSNNNHNPDNKKDSHSKDDQPQNDERPKSSVNFLDLNSLEKEYSFKFVTQYNQLDARSAWAKLKLDQSSIFKTVLFIKQTKILEKYKIAFFLEKEPEIDNNKGIINKVKIKFTKDDKFEIREFSFIDFKKIEIKIDPKINKENYITPKKILDKNIKGLYPSLLAYMLLYSEDNKKYKSLEEKTNVINFEELKNSNDKLFEKNSINFGVGTKELLFDYKEEFNKLYKDKIIAAKYDDINGELTLKVNITNTKENTNDKQIPDITKEFTFKDLRKINLKEPNKNVLNLSLTDRNLKNIYENGSLKDTVNSLLTHKAFNVEIPLESTSKYDLKGELFKNLNVYINDKENSPYRSSQTLSLYKDNKNDNNLSIIGLTNNMSLYPFHTRVTKDSISNIKISIKNDNNKNELVLKFDISFSVYTSTFSDLTSYAYDKEEILKFQIISKTQI